MILAILQARTSSRRLPRKVLLDVLGQPMLLRQLERVGRAKRIDGVVVATSTDPSDDEIESLCSANGIRCERGSLEDVLDRFYRAVATARPSHVVRLTGDCPLTDPAIIDAVVEHHLREGADYTTNALPPTFPDGLDVEVMKFGALERAWREASAGAEREHVTPYLYRHPELFHLASFGSGRDLSQLRWTVDEPRDYMFISRVYEALYARNPEFGIEEILGLLRDHPEIAGENQPVRNEGFLLSQKKDQLAARYKKSNEMLERALKAIPLGSQTFSKSKTQYPGGVSPYFIERGRGSRVWDVDGNEFVDFVNSLAAVTLGYCDEDVTRAVQEQLACGTIFSLPSPLEVKVAEKIQRVVPCAEMVRFGKNGSDVTSAAIRLARAFTRRDRVIASGYHGWQDWYIGATARNLGVPPAVSQLTHMAPFGDIEAFRQLFAAHKGEVAAVIVEPMNVKDPPEGFLASLKELAHKEGALLIFDETITGFRFALGGAQEKFGVVPDLGTFGKAIANGYPLSALAGRADVMRLMEEIFFSATFGGEALSLAAGLATIEKLEKNAVIPHLYSQGEKVMRGVGEEIKAQGLEKVFSLSGNPTWSFLTVADAGGYSQWQIKTLFLQEMFMRGILMLSTHNISFAHSDEDIRKLLSAYREVLREIREGVEAKTLEKKLLTKPLEPLFKIR